MSQKREYSSSEDEDFEHLNHVSKHFKSENDIGKLGI